MASLDTAIVCGTSLLMLGMLLWALVALSPHLGDGADDEDES